VIYIEGGTKSQRQLAKDLYYFCSQALSIKKPVDIDLRIQDVDHAEAWTDHEGEGKFEKDLTTSQFITAFCHEMIHVIQHLRDKSISEKEAYKLEVGLAEQFKSLNKS